jgi:hypothetical protein
MSMMAMPPASTWTVRSSVQASFRIGLENFTAFLVVALLFAAPGFILEMRGVDGIPKYGADIAGNIAAYICILCGTLHALDDRVLGVTDTLRQINRPALIGLLALGVVQSIAVVVASLFFIVPALYLITIWAVTVPAMLVEGTDLRDSFRRSAELTRGRRWRVLGASVVCVLIVVAVFTAISAVLHAVPMVSERIELQTLLRWLAGAACAAFIHPLSAILYTLLRQEKEGLSIAQIVGTLD